MYVIFPADELILMTYGAALPRIKPRPTLDCLRDPLVTTIDRPLPPLVLQPTHLTPTTSAQQHKPPPSPRVIKPPLMHSSAHDDSSNTRPTSSRYNPNEFSSTVVDPNALSESEAAVDDPYQDQYGISRERSSSPYLERPSSTASSRPTTPSSKPKSPQIKTKTRPKLNISLGRLGRQQREQNESSRLREDLHLHVENPTFTRENLSQRNFDAFFESGEPVYKLQPKPASSTNPESESLSPTASFDTASGGYEQTASSKLSPRVFGRSKDPLNSRSKSADYDSEKSTTATTTTGVPQKGFSGKSSGGQKGRSFFGWRGPRGGSLSPQASMASYNGVLKEYGHPNMTEAFKSQNNVTFKLIKTVSDFNETLSHLYEEHATALQTLVSNYRKKNGELRKERPACHSSIFQAWEQFLQEVESDVQASNDVASVLSRQVSRPMLDKSFHRKVQSRKIFTHRESFETIIAKTEEKLSKCRLDYKQCYVAHRQSPTQLSLTEYIDAHNAYVQQLHATNAMLDTYHCETVPQLMQELEEIHNDLSSIIAESILQGADVIANKASEQAKRYSSLTTQCNGVMPQQDLANFVRILPIPANSQKVPKRPFAPPQPPGEAEDVNEYNDMTPVLRNELVFERYSSLQLRPALDSLKREAADLEMQIRQLQDSVDSMNRTQLRGIEGQLYNKVNELQEDLSMKKFDLRAKQLHFAAVRAQKDLFVSKLDPGSPRGERKLSAASASSMKTKWLKAFRSLKPASGSAAQPDRRNGATGGAPSQPLRPNEDGSHHLQEYTYKKITACDVCSQILRGHTRQGLRCRICKLNTHGDCASQLPRCQAKQKLLRRQKSTSELENRVDVEEETPHSPRRQKLNLRMKSLSLDSPESSELHGQMRRRQPIAGTSSYYHGGSGGQLEHSTPPSNNSRLHSPSSPSGGHQRKLLYANRGMRTGSVDLPDDIEKSLSSASTSPCPSPKSHRLLPTNLYVILYNFKARHADELDLKAGYKVTVIETSDPDWWKGKLLGRVGYFPSKYCARLNAGEKPLQVTHNLQVSDGERGENMTLLRDQIVIQTGDEVNGMVMVRSADNRQGYCPIKYLQEV